jgi:hypothetical protein
MLGTPWFTRGLIIASFVPFVLACALPVVYVNLDVGDKISGMSFLLFGWFGAFLCQFGWFANLAACISALLLLADRVGASRLGSVVALLIACDTLFLKSLPVGMSDPTQEGFRNAIITGWGPGAYLWAASIVIVFAASFLAKSSR